LPQTKNYGLNELAGSVALHPSLHNVLRISSVINWNDWCDSLLFQNYWVIHLTIHLHFQLVQQLATSILELTSTDSSGEVST
jgi:hypothetical protein